MGKGVYRIIVALIAPVTLLSMISLVSIGSVMPSVQAQESSRAFPETGETIAGKFLDYWINHGGLAQQGYPISKEMQERSDTDGKTYTVQYFERAVFEMHPENGPPNDVLLALLGNFLYHQKYPNEEPGQRAHSEPGTRLFSETGKHLGGMFLDYWKSHGGLAQQGFPISEEFQEKSDLDGKTYTVQYFERAVFEMHPENQPPYNVLLSQLGTFRHHAKYMLPATVVPPVAPTATTGSTSGINEVHIVLSFKHIEPMDLTIPEGKTRFIVTNVDTQFGQTPHNFSIYADQAAIKAGTPLGATPSFVPSEGPKVFELDLRPGNYLTRCDVPGHAEVGMIGTLIVTPAP